MPRFQRARASSGICTDITICCRRLKCPACLNIGRRSTGFALTCNGSTTKPPSRRSPVAARTHCRGIHRSSQLVVVLVLLLLPARRIFWSGILGTLFGFMARSLARIMLKGISESSYSFRSTVAFESFNRQCVSYSTATSDSDTHEDFQPTRKLEGGSLKDIVEQDIKENSIMIYMKGIPDAPRCGFSALAVKVLKEYGIPFSARNILEDQVLKDSVKAVSNWPTFPQIFIKGEFVGGSDIILGMHQSGELKEKLKDIAAPSTGEQPR